MSKNKYEKAIEVNGKLPHCTDIGGYPVYYINHHNSVFCDDCANKYADEIVAHEIHWEGQPLTCDDCNKDIESAYGDPNEEEIQEQCVCGHVNCNIHH